MRQHRLDKLFVVFNMNILQEIRGGDNPVQVDEDLTVSVVTEGYQLDQYFLTSSLSDKLGSVLGSTSPSEIPMKSVGAHISLWQDPLSGNFNVY